jgi:hypothetical protein
MTHTVIITEVLKRVVKVDAASPGEAFADVREKWDDNRIELNENDFISVKFEHASNY